MRGFDQYIAEVGLIMDLSASQLFFITTKDTKNTKIIIRFSKRLFLLLPRYLKRGALPLATPPKGRWTLWNPIFESANSGVSDCLGLPYAGIGFSLRENPNPRAP